MDVASSWRCWLAETVGCLGETVRRCGCSRAVGAVGAVAVTLLALYQLCAPPALQMSQLAEVEAEVEMLDEQGPLESTTAASWPNSTCGASATARGPHQWVVAFSFYGNVNHFRDYFKGIERNAAAIGHMYPGWTMRVYHDVAPTNDSAASSELERLSREFPHLDFCYVGDVPGYGDLRDRQQNTWRFLPMADPLVDVFISRDLDALLLEREVEAVGEWLESNVTFHVMRDHRDHTIPIMAGMWGARPHLKRKDLRALAEAITGQPRGERHLDQKLLTMHVWPAIRGDVWQHDAYYCQTYRSHGHMRPFPTRRNQTAAYNFVGNIDGIHTKPVLKECPLPCRPIQHQDWLYC